MNEDIKNTIKIASVIQTPVSKFDTSFDVPIVKAAQSFRPMEKILKDFLATMPKVELPRAPRLALTNMDRYIGKNIKLLNMSQLGIEYKVPGLNKEVLKNFTQQNEQLKNHLAEWGKIIAPGLLELAKVIQPIALKLREVIPPVMRDVAAFAENVRVTMEKVDELSCELEKEKLFLIPYFSSFPDIRENVRRIKEENLTMLEIYDKFFQDKNNLLAVLEHWMENQFFRDRKEILRQCLMAHADGSYALSIPVFYIHIEKYCKQLIGIEKPCPAEVWKKKLREAFPKEKNLDGLARLMSPEIVMDYIINEIFEHFVQYSLRDDSVYPNRHEVQHGDDLNYFEKKHASLRCILLLDMLSEIEPTQIQVIEKSSIVKHHEA